MKKTKHRLSICRLNKQVKRVLFDQYILNRLRKFYEDKSIDRQERYVMFKFSHHLVNYVRTGSIGTCVDCPDYENLKYPEKCKNKNRYDHKSSYKNIMFHFRAQYKDYDFVKDYIIKSIFD